MLRNVLVAQSDKSVWHLKANVVATGTTARGTGAV